MLLFLYAEHGYIPRNISENGGDTIDYQRVELGRRLGIVVSVVFGFIALVGIPGNCVVIYVSVWRKFTFENVNTALVTVLAVVDLCFILLRLPFDITTLVTMRWCFGGTWCQVMNYFTYVSFTLLAGILTLMSYDRCLAIMYPLSSIRMRRTRNMMIAFLCIFIVSVIVYVPVFFLYHVMEYTHDGNVMSACGPSMTGTFSIMSLKVAQIHYVMFGIVGYGTPLLLTTAMFVRTCGTLRDKKKKIRPGYVQNDADFSSVKFVLVVTSAFFISWTLFQISLFLVRVMRYPSAPVSTPVVVASVVASCFACASSCMNPVLYLWLSKAFRRRVFPCRRCVKERQESASVVRHNNSATS